MTLHFGKVDAGSTLYIPFTTYGSNGSSITLTGLAVTDIEIYKNGSTTQRASDNGYTLLDTDGIDFDGITGLHGFSIDLSDNSDSGFYSDGAQYWVVVSAVTVDSQTVNFLAATFTIGNVSANVVQISGDSVAADNLEAYTDGTTPMPVNATQISGDATAADNLEAQFDGTGLTGATYPATQDQVSHIAASGAGIAFDASSYTLTTGTQTSGTYASTTALDGTYHEHTDTAGALDLYYEFQIGNATPNSVVITGYLTGSNDSLEVYAYNFGLTTWERIGTFSGQGGVANVVRSYVLFSDQVGTGGDLGKVRIRFTDGAFTLTSATLAIDQIYVSTSYSIDAAGIRSAVGLASANLDTQLSTIDTVVDSILVDTAEIGVAGAGLTALASQTSVNTIDDFLDTEIAAIKAKTDNLPASPAATGDIPSAAAVATAVRSELTTELGRIDVAVSTRLASAGYTAPTSASAIADAVWDEAQADHATAGTFGELATEIAAILDDTGTSGVLVNAASVRTAVGLASANLDTQLDAIPTATENADALLKRDMSAVTGEADRSPLNALRRLRNKNSLSGATLTITKENDSTAAWTATVTTDANAEPITAVDPAG